MAIRLAIDTIPPFLMAGSRFSIAGLLFLIWCYWRFDKRPTIKDWGHAAIPGILLFVCGNGSLTWAEQYIPSGLAALIIATLSLWMVLLEWLVYKGKRPDFFTIIGIFLGLAGVAILTTVGEEVLLPSGEDGVTLTFGIIVLAIAAASWAAGSLYSRHVISDIPIQFAISMQIVVGGIVLLVIGTIQNEWAAFSFKRITLISHLAMVYMVFFGSLLAYSAYVWLMRVSTPAKVGTYAFFNPLVAVLLGWLLLEEPLTLQTLVAAGCILISILLVNRSLFKIKSNTSRNL
jgi:drug/metabolite transporter (DMT)-like permease